MKKYTSTVFLKSFVDSYFDLFLSITIALFGIYIFYPGAMSGDSVNQWYQVTNPEMISSWFPPSMVYLWIVLNKITYGPQGMLIFQYIILNLSIWLLARIFYHRVIHRVIFICFICFFPPIFFITGVIWKDVSVFVSLSMSFALLFKFELNRKKIFLLLSILFFIYTISVRHNSVVCLLPYIIYILSILIKSSISKKTILITILTPIFFYGGVKLSNFLIHGIVKKENVVHHMENATFIWDLWGMSVELNKNIIPEYVFSDTGRLLTIEQLKRLYEPYTCSIIYLPHINPYRCTDNADKFPDKIFKKDFIRLILKYPAAYLKVRSRLVLYMLGIKWPVPHVPAIVAFEFNIYKPSDKQDVLYEPSKHLEMRHKIAMEKSFYVAYWFLMKTYLYRVWVYIVLIILQLVAAISYKAYLGDSYRRIVLILSIGLIYWFPYIIISTSSDFRFSIPTVYCGIIALPLLIHRIFSYHKNIFSSRKMPLLHS
ncbi:MAG: hypothetical protein CDV28_12236 [Candidatus Electronema aureum]|uniref:Dolichyl-phosphate-mannose-protein mannosyltransferase n=1 Tax=Candidatus Electronema aureum TaxID=2005002 RepID=A0A521G0P6_9BACT|nr:MAG: hypothetical protein CDV28_12236 [Candidatus Electronema aureum]